MYKKSCNRRRIKRTSRAGDNYCPINNAARLLVRLRVCRFFSIAMIIKTGKSTASKRRSGAFISLRKFTVALYSVCLRRHNPSFAEKIQLIGRYDAGIVIYAPGLWLWGCKKKVSPCGGCVRESLHGKMLLRQVVLKFW